MDSGVKILGSLALILLLAGCTNIQNILGKINSTTNQTQIAAQTNVSNQSINTTNQTNPPQEPVLIVPPLHPGNLTVYYIDVGQGDSIFVVGPSNKTMLIDCGPTNAASKVIDFIRNLGFSTIDFLVVSHQHDDHIGGCPVEIFKLKPSKIYDNGHLVTTDAYNNYKQAWGNAHLAIGQDSPFEFDILPAFFIVPYDDGQGFVGDENGNSLLVRLVYGNEAFLFTGDCDNDCESRILNSQLTANILKIGHHGSKYSSSVVFLNQVQPSIGVISAGAGNQYGHPHAETLEKLKQQGVTVYRTDLDGSVAITTDSKTLGVEKVK